jgi:hypothetical protein
MSPNRSAVLATGSLAFSLIVACGGLIDSSESPTGPLDDGGSLPSDAGVESVTRPPATDVGTSPGDSGSSDSGSSRIVSCGDASLVDLDTDDANCGACGVPCAGTCTLGRCMIVLAAVSEATGLAVDAENVYFSAYDRTVKKVPTSGGAVTTLVSGLKAPWGIAVDATTLYYADANIFGGGFQATLGSVPIAGGPNTVLVTSLEGGRFVALADGNIYWDSGNYVNSTDHAEIEFVSKSGGTATALIPGTAAINGIVAAGDTLFYVDDFGVWAISLAGGSPRSVATGGGYSLALDETYAYYLSTGSILRVPLAGGPVVTLASGLNTPQAIAVDSTDVYVAVEYGINESYIAKVSKSGGPVVTLVGGQQDTTAIAVDEASVYWLCTHSAGSVRKLSK